MGVLRLLRRGRAVLHLFKWCSGAFARDKRGEECGTHDGDACMFCAIGALDRGAGLDFCGQAEGNAKVYNHARACLDLSVPVDDFGDPLADVESFNDDSDGDSVRALYDRAIRYAVEALGPGSV